MELELGNKGIPQEMLEAKVSSARGAYRLGFQAESDVIQKRLGNIDQIRLNLGLSRRKLCQLLLMDPSSYNHWMKHGAPPYVYRALEWFCRLQEKYPGLGPQLWLSSSISVKELSTQVENRLEDKLREHIDDEVGKLQRGGRVQYWGIYLIFTLILGFLLGKFAAQML